MSASTTTTERTHELAALVVLALPAVVGAVALLLVARQGVYASPDSTFYVGTARNLLDGRGLTAPPGTPELSHFPPLFPLALAAIGWVTGLDPLDAAGVLNPLLLGVTALLVALVVRRRSGSVPLGAAAAVAVVVALDVGSYYVSALSEPLFIVLVLAAMVSLAAAVDGGSRWAWAAAVALPAAACLTRYVGVALVAAEVVVLIVLVGRKALGRAFAFAALALAPLVVWLAVAGRGNRPVVFHLADADYWVGAARSVSRWVLPAFTPSPLPGLVTAALVAGLGWVVLHRRPRSPEEAESAGSGRRPDALGVLPPAFAVTYLTMLVADRVFLDATGRLDLRFLAVLHVVAVVGLLPWLHRTLGGRTRRLAVAGGLALVGVHGVQAVSWVAAGLTDTDIGRRGLTAQAWRDSAVLAAVAALPPDVAVYSNGPEAIFFLTGRSTSSLPVHTDYLSGRRRPQYRAELAAMDDRLAREDGVVVWFRPYAFRERFVTPIGDLALDPLLEDGVATLSRPRGL